MLALNTHDTQQEFQGRDSMHKKQNQYQYHVLIAFVIIIAALIVFKVYLSNDQDKRDAEFYREHLMSYQLIQFWKMSAEQQNQEQKDSQKKLINRPEHQISRQQLGHSSWTLLHMVTGAFPQFIPPNLVKKFNTFLILFGQMYPCKLCANHFMELLKKQGLFTGSSKVQLMQYLCNIHNKVNEKLGKPIHSCTNVYDEWNTCGCSQSS